MLGIVVYYVNTFLNKCFSSLFRTIGDAYICATNLLEDDEDGALNIMGDATLDVLDIQDLDTSIALKKENLLSDVIELR